METTMQIEQVRRRADGSIDVEFYRDRGLNARRAVINGFAAGLWRVARPVTAAVVAIGLCVIAIRSGSGLL